MPNRCAVPRCKAGGLKKCSMFRVPSNGEQYKKWQAAIPGSLDLKQSQFICEKHFEPRFIHRKWIKRDSDGRIIAQAPYGRPVLDPAAIPSLFDGDDAEQQRLNQKVTVKLAVASNTSIGNCVIVEHSYCAPIRLAESKAIDSIPDERTDESPVTPPIPTEGTKLAITQIASIDRSQTDESSVVSPSTMASVESIVLKAAGMDFRVGINEAMKNEAIVDKDAVPIPRSWSVGALGSVDDRTFIFSRFVTKMDNGVKSPIIEKTVTITADNTIRYYVYGRNVDAHQWNLAQSLDQAKVLGECLQKFENTSICNGLGNVNVIHLSVDSAFRDYVDRWHHNDCTLISRRKRCNNCTSMKKLVGKRELRFKTGGTLTRVHRASNPNEQRKIIALRNRNVRQRRQKNTAVRRVHSLQQSLREK